MDLQLFLENALRRFKRKVQAEEIIREVKRHSYYLKPGEKRRVKFSAYESHVRVLLRAAGRELHAMGC